MFAEMAWDRTIIIQSRYRKIFSTGWDSHKEVFVGHCLITAHFSKQFIRLALHRRNNFLVP